MLCWRLLGQGQVVRAIDEAYMRERLREVSYLPLEPRIVFLRQQPKVVAQREQPLEHIARLAVAAGQRKVIDQPEGAGQKRALAGRESVHSGFGLITADQTVVHELALDSGDGADDARIFCREKSDQRD